MDDTEELPGDTWIMANPLAEYTNDVPEYDKRRKVSQWICQ
jgi:hypothetical protein